MEVNEKALDQLSHKDRELYYQTKAISDYFSLIVGFNNVAARWFCAYNALESFERDYKNVVNDDGFNKMKAVITNRLMFLTEKANEEFSNAISFYKKSFGVQPKNFNQYMYLDEIKTYYDMLNQTKCDYQDPDIETIPSYEDDDYTEETLDQERLTLKQ